MWPRFDLGRQKAPPLPSASRVHQLTAYPKQRKRSVDINIICPSAVLHNYSPVLELMTSSASKLRTDPGTGKVTVNI